MKTLREAYTEIERLSKANHDLLEALKPFAEVYGRRSRLIGEMRGMDQVAKSHRVALYSEQADGHFGYLSIKAFRAAHAAVERATPS